MTTLGATYQARDYWSARIRGDGALSNVGQQALGPYNRFTYPLRLEALGRALSGIAQHGCRVFDAGFGEGVYLDWWRRRGAGRIAGVDFSPRAVQAGLVRHPECDLRVGDLSVPGDLRGFGGFDVVTAIDVLYHIVDDGAWAIAVQNLLSLVDGTGVMVFSDKFPREGSWQNFPHVRRRSFDMWQSVIEAGGFKVIRRVPVFVLMDDPIPCGSHPWLARVARAQWRVSGRLIRQLAPLPRLQHAVAATIAMAQLPPERILVRLLNRTPNLELAVCRRVQPRWGL